MGLIVSPCEFGAVSKDMAPDGADTLYEIRVFEKRGYYEDPTKISTWQTHTIHCWAIRCQCDATAKRYATRAAKQFNLVDLITLYKRDGKHHIDPRYYTREIWRREKQAAARNWRPWEAVKMALEVTN